MKSNKAFTFIELVITLVIVALIATMMIGAINKIKAGPDTIYQVTCRHGDGTATVYKTFTEPTKPDGSPGIKVFTVEGPMVYVSGDVIIEQFPYSALEKR